MAASMIAFHRTDIWNMDPTMSRPGTSCFKKEVAVVMPVTDEENKFLIETEKLRLIQDEMQRGIGSALHIFQGTSFDRRI